MFIRASTKQCLFAFQDMPSLVDIREDHGIQVANMRSGIDIEYRRGDVIRFFGGRLGRHASSIGITTEGI